MQSGMYNLHILTCDAEVGRTQKFFELNQNLELFELEHL